jgi:UDP-N-acetyl-D-mannosaminuronic acid dehydrogenase
VKGDFSHVCVIGLGYVGLPMAAVLASRGIRVTGVDINEASVAAINRGEVPIVEPDLDIMVRGAVAAGMLSAAAEPIPADAFIIAVPTPFSDDLKPDVSHVRAAAKSLAAVLKKGDLVVVESTSPVGTTEGISEYLAELRRDLTFPHAAGEAADVQVAHSPERVLPGRVLLELVRNDRVVGGVTPACAQRTAALYRMFVDGECLLTTARTAELVKLAENAYRDVNIAFANELSLVCDRLGINVWDAVALANRHPRVDILKPGPGVGGHCIAVDPWFIVDSAPNDTALIRAARGVNDSKPRHVAAQVTAAAIKTDASVVACLGLSYKADIDDLRESPGVKIVELLAAGWSGDIWVVEPYVNALPARLAGLEKVRLANLEDALDAAQVVALLTDHQAFKDIPPQRLAAIKEVIDTRGIWR